MSSIPHPRETTRLVGHEEAETQFLDAVNSGRLHHAWLLVGPRGIGKATLAYRMARHLLAKPAAGGLFAGEAGDGPATLDMPPDDPVFRRVAAGSHGSLKVVEREFDEKRGAPKRDITVDAVRALRDFFTRTAAEDGWRVAIVDAADEMNRNAANALLKTLEEPPEGAILILICHSPGRLPATVRSRCRQLQMQALPTTAVEDILADCLPDLAAADRGRLAALAEGSPGRALAWGGTDGMAEVDQVYSVLKALPHIGTERMHAVATALAGPRAEGKYIAFLDLVDLVLSRLIRDNIDGEPQEGGTVIDAGLARHLLGLASLDRWLEVWEKSRRTAARASALNLDRKQVILSLFTSMEAACANPGKGN